MITVAAGQRAALVWEASAALDDPMVTIVPTAGGNPVVGPTADGLGVDGTTYTFVWQVPAGADQGSYTAVLDGTSGGDPVEVESEVFVTSLPVYLSLADLKESVHITDTDRDAALARALAAASRSIDLTTGRRFWLDAEASARVINPRGRITRDDDGEHLLIDDLGAVDDLVVEIGRGSSWTDITASVEAEPTDALAKLRPITSLLRVGGSWPSGGGQRVRVAERWGWPQYPDQVVQASGILAMRLFKRKDSPEGVLGSAEWGVIRLSRNDPDVYGLIQPFILPGFG
ncbi:hypothetical protein ACWDA3_26085 [Nonomuraea rubra]